MGDGRWTLAYTAALAINIAECTGGTVTTSPATYTTAGTEVTITATPAENYVLTSITVTDAAGTEVTVTDSKFTMPETAVTVTVVFTTTDGIEAVVADDADNAEIFNLQGVRVNKAQKGIYIVNGKKVLVK